MFHPGEASIDCNECKRFIFDLKTGEKKTYKAGPRREEMPWVRPLCVPTPCGDCPKKSPEEAERCKLSNKNWRTWQLFKEMRATNGAAFTPAMRRDRVLLQNFAVLDCIQRQYEQEQLANCLTYQIAMLLRGK